MQKESQMQAWHLITHTSPPKVRGVVPKDQGHSRGDAHSPCHFGKLGFTALKNR